MTSALFESQTDGAQSVGLSFALSLSSRRRRRHALLRFSSSAHRRSCPLTHRYSSRDRGALSTTRSRSNALALITRSLDRSLAHSRARALARFRMYHSLARREITESLAEHDAAHPDRPAAPFAVNQIVHRRRARGRVSFSSRVGCFRSCTAGVVAFRFRRTRSCASGARARRVLEHPPFVFFVRVVLRGRAPPVRRGVVWDFAPQARARARVARSDRSLRVCGFPLMCLRARYLMQLTGSATLRASARVLLLL